MSSAGVWSVEWLDHNSERSYPLAQDASKKSLSGLLRVPDNFLCDLSIAVSSSFNVNPSRFILYRLSVDTSNILLTFGYASTSGNVPVASARIAVATFSPFSPYPLQGQGNFYDTVGTVTIGEIRDLVRQPPGFYEFGISEGRLETEVVRPQLRGVSRLAIGSGSAAIYLDGDVRLEGGRNCRIVVDESATPAEVRIDFIDGEGSVEDCDCGANIGDAVPIRYINDIPGTADGRFYLEGGECVDMTPITAGLQISNTCAQPCCSEQTKEELVDLIKTLEGKIRTVENFVAGLQASVSQTDMSILATTIYDRGNQQCS